MTIFHASTWQGSLLENSTVTIFKASVAEPHHFYAALICIPAPGENFDAASFPQLRLLSLTIYAKIFKMNLG
jgi:hypothetical protein